MTKKETVTLKNLAKSVQNLAEAVDTIIDNSVHIAKEIQVHKDECIKLCNRVNELELSAERKNGPIIKPVVTRKRRMEVRNPYPRKKHPLSKVYYRLRRILNAST